jgi:hypothetical protein
VYLGKAKSNPLQQKQQKVSMQIKHTAFKATKTTRNFGRNTRKYWKKVHVWA